MIAKCLYELEQNRELYKEVIKRLGEFKDESYNIRMELSDNEIE